MGDRLVKADVGSARINVRTMCGSTRTGCYPCYHCINCKLMIKGDTFLNPATGGMMKITQFLTCDSSYVVYQLTCPCGKWYVGETTWDVKTRLNQHRYSIRKEKMDLPVSKHFKEAGHTQSDLRFRVLEQVELGRRGGDRQAILKKRKLYWIYTLKTLRPNGLNVDFRVD